MLWPVAVLGAVAGAALAGLPGTLPGLACGALLDRHLYVHDWLDLQERLQGRDELQVDALLLLHAMGWLLAECPVDAATDRLRWQLLAQEAAIAGLPEPLARRAWLRGARQGRLLQLMAVVDGRPLRRDYLLRLGWRLLWLQPDCPATGRQRLEQLAGLLDSPPGRLHALEQALLGRRSLQPHAGQELLAALEVLGMPTGSSESDLRRAYRRLLARWHPDRHQQAGPERVAQATERTRQIRQAWEQICRLHGWR